MNRSRANWERALEDPRVARHILSMSPNTAASRAYYSIFHAVTALFLLEQKEFTTHRAVEMAVHRDLVKSGRWPTELGRAFSAISDYRGIGDYGQEEHVTEEQGRQAIEGATAMLAAIAAERPDLFSLDEM